MSGLTEDHIASVLAHISSGRSVRKSCELVGVPVPTFLKNVDGDQYARARDAQADAHFDEMTELEEQCRSGELDPAAFRALLDSRKWRLARMRPKIYGDKSTVDMTSSDGSMTQGPAVVIDFSGMSPDDIAAAARAAFKGE
jgi:hypothetical protein